MILSELICSSSLVILSVLISSNELNLIISELICNYCQYI